MTTTPNEPQGNEPATPATRGLLGGFIGAVKSVAGMVGKGPVNPDLRADTPAKPVSDEESLAAKLLDEKIVQARHAADSFVDANLEKLKAEAWLMVDMPEKRLDSKLEEFERRLDQRLEKEIYYKLVGLRWTLIFVLIVSLIGIGYKLIVSSGAKPEQAVLTQEQTDKPRSAAPSPTGEPVKGDK